MENFKIYNPTELHFGRGVTDNLGKVISKYGNKVLLVYGKSSIKKNEIYDKVKTQIESNNGHLFEYGGIKSNPVIEDVEAAVKLGQESQIDVILAVGGGSVIDSAKVISAAILLDIPAWELFEKEIKIKDTIPLITVLTLAATGTEMNSFAVIQNEKAGKKAAWGNKLVYPKHSFLDPSFTLSVPRNYTAYGIMDFVAHALEAWFGKGESSLADKFVVSIIKEAMEYGPKLLNNLNNYDLRARIMYSATMALNGTTLHGRSGGDWGVHSAGHVLSLLFDIPHGASLSIMYPAWLKLIAQENPERIILLGKELFNEVDPMTIIQKLENFFVSIDCPIRLYDIGIPIDNKPKIVDSMNHNKVNGNNYQLNKIDYEIMVALI